MSASELIVYRTEDGKTEVRLKAEDGSAWRSQGEMVELFDTTKQNVSLHIKNILEEGELPEPAVVKECLTTADDSECGKIRNKEIEYAEGDFSGAQSGTAEGPCGNGTR